RPASTNSRSHERRAAPGLCSELLGSGADRRRSVRSMSRSPVWHPFTQHGLEPDMLPIARSEGAWLETADSRRIFDGSASWWVSTHGHRHPKIVRAIQEQADKLDQLIFAGFTHEPAEAVARGLVEIAPRGLTHVFFSDSGSTSVEVALKMALGHWK